MAGREEFTTVDVRVSYRTRVYSDAHPDITRAYAVDVFYRYEDRHFLVSIAADVADQTAGAGAFTVAVNGLVRERESLLGKKVKVKSCIAVRANASPLRELTCHMRSHSVTCHPAEVTFPPLPQSKLVLDLATPEGCKAELTWLVG